MPDINSLPPRPSTTRIMSNDSIPPRRPSELTPSPSPSRTASVSLQAAAAVNAGLQHEPTRRPSFGSLSRHPGSPNGRRRSQVLMNLQMNDPTLPGPGEMASEQPQHASGSPVLTSSGDPHHDRAPSLGSLHQDMEAEQEAQVNRLLGMIREQQVQLQQYQSQNHSTSAVAGDDSPETSTTPAPIPPPNTSVAPSSSATPYQPSPISLPRSPVFPYHPRTTYDVARADLQRRSRTPSRGASPRLRSTSISQDSGEPLSLGGRDESAFYQAETQMLTRENQMLKHRIRDLERQLADLNTGGIASVTNEPAQHSNLAQSVPEEGISTPMASTESLSDRPKEEL